MIEHDVEQGSEAWLRVRAGIPTSSMFDKIVTKSGAASKSATKYMNELLAERMMGHPLEEHVSLWMMRGRELEAEAVLFYEAQRNLDTKRIGFITNDDGTIGTSPDRAVGADGLVELKVPAPHTHVHYLLARELDAEYRPQVQGQLWLTERKWVDLCSYHPEMPKALIRVERDEGFIKILREHVTAFSLELEAMARECKRRGWIPEESRAQTFDKLSQMLRSTRRAEDESLSFE